MSLKRKLYLRSALPLIVLVASSAACVHESPFECSVSAECGSEGRCEASGFCSFGDSSCETGRRYGELADSEFAGECVAVMAVYGATGSIEPRDVAIGSLNNRFTYTVGLDVQAGDTGVDRVEIDVPANFGLPRIVAVLVNDSEVAFVDTTAEHSVAIELDEHVRTSSVIALLFDADAKDMEDMVGQAFSATVSDSTKPSIPGTEIRPASPESLLVTTSIWVAASEIESEISPNQAAPDSTTEFSYDLRIVIGEANTGVDLISLTPPSHLQLTGMLSVEVDGAPVAFSSGVSATDIVLADKLVTTSEVSIGFEAEVVACSNDRRGEVLVSVDDSSSAYAAQEGLPGSVDGDPADGNSQSVVSQGAPRLYWSDRMTARIQSGVNDSCGVDTLVSGLTDPRLIAGDLATEHVNWADVDVGQIWRAKLDGTGLEVLVTGLVSPGGVAIDATAGKLYWTDYGTDRIQRSNLNGTSVENLLVHGPLPYGIELDLENQKMYWADTTDGLVLRANLDGSNVEQVLSGISQAADIEVAGSRLYVSAHGTGTIVRANLDGSGASTIISGQNEPVGLAFDVIFDRLYWADSGSGRIRSSTANGGDIQDLVTGLSDPQGLILGR